MAPNHLITVKKILTSLKREFLPYVFEAWECLADADIESHIERLNIVVSLSANSTLQDSLVNEGVSRKKIIDVICEACKTHGVRKKDIADLDLLCTQLHPERKRWSVFEVVKDEAGGNELTDPETLCERFGAQLSLHINHDLCMRVHSRAIWLRVGFKSTNNVMHRNNSVFIVFHPHSPYLITTPMKKKHQEAIFQALLDMLDARDILECYLSGKNLESLQELTLTKHSQGSFSKYRLNQVDRNPLVKLRAKKRKGSVLDDLNIHTTDENAKENRRNDDITDDVFGSNPQPKLQKLEYKMKTRLRGSPFVPSLEVSTAPFRCTVQFEGVNVVEGIKQLSQAGLATLPLPPHLAKVHSLAKNRFLLADKD